ncbi:MAG TPA: exodeoxyribonuclease III [Acetobacteraceae bacterium]|nr:exodeoxyribonuclease III [Acetobacteraceae bacterium]
MPGPLLVIDGDSFAHRSYHALPKSIRRSGDRGGGAIVGFANFLLRLYQAEKPRAVLVAWDTLGAPTYRQRLFPDYQGGRQFDAELVDQLDALPEFVTACGFAVAKAAGYEADDFLAAAVAAEQRRGGTALVASGDRDAFQLASETTTILHPMRAGEMARVGPAEVRERYGVDPSQVPDFIALRGDPSDRLPGATGVGPKGAATILHRYGTLERALVDGRFADQADALRRYRQIATMDAEAPLPPLENQTPSWDTAAVLAREWGLDALGRRLTEQASSGARPAPRRASHGPRASPALKIATFNINNVNRRLPNLLSWLAEAKPGVACLQELKATDAAFPADAVRQAGYRALWRGERTYNGVAILAASEPQLTRSALPGDPKDTQSRYIEAAVQGVLVACIYLPNGNPQPGPKFAYKLAWFERLIAHARSLYALDAPVVLAGDFNVVPTDHDIYPSKSWAKDALLQPESRDCFRRLLEQGWVDAVRTRHPDAPMYSFWDYKRERCQRDAGLRIDFLLLNPPAAARLIDAGVDRAVRGEEGASDHAPVWATLRAG